MQKSWASNVTASRKVLRSAPKYTFLRSLSNRPSDRWSIQVNSPPSFSPGVPWAVERRGRREGEGRVIVKLLSQLQHSTPLVSRVGERKAAAGFFLLPPSGVGWLAEGTFLIFWQGEVGTPGGERRKHRRVCIFLRKSKTCRRPMLRTVSGYHMIYMFIKYNIILEEYMI